MKAQSINKSNLPDEVGELGVAQHLQALEQYVGSDSFTLWYFELDVEFNALILTTIAVILMDSKQLLNQLELFFKFCYEDFFFLKGESSTKILFHSHVFWAFGEKKHFSGK